MLFTFVTQFYLVNILWLVMSSYAEANYCDIWTLQATKSFSTTWIYTAIQIQICFKYIKGVMVLMPKKHYFATAECLRGLR